MAEHIKGYKIFDENLRCRGFQFEVGKIFSEDVEPQITLRGFHFSPTLAECINYKPFRKNSRVCEVESLGEVSMIPSNGVGKSPFIGQASTNKIKIIRELSKEEIYSMLNTGSHNIGYNNIGHGNIGKENIGCSNESNRNIGSQNRGNENIGDCNKGTNNIGYMNYGNKNIGWGNFGSNNHGADNYGCFNIGDCNHGNHNIGDSNLGDYNVGNFNLGDHNQGNLNTGSYCIGDFNSGDFRIGCFNTEEINKKEENTGNGKLMFFNKYSDFFSIDDWKRSKAYRILETMTPNLKDSNKINALYKITEAWNNWWNTLSDEQKAIITDMPNFDKDIFYEITEISQFSSDSPELSTEK